VEEYACFGHLFISNRISHIFRREASPNKSKNNFLFVPARGSGCKKLEAGFKVWRLLWMLEARSLR
jgi:hypothetical protein